MAIVLTGCETIHTGVLGDIPTGMKPLGMMEEGAIYQDPKSRFSVVVPDSRNLVAKAQQEGVVFYGKELDRGDLIYAVLVYPMPYESLLDNDALSATFDGIKYQIENKSYKVEILRKQFTEHKGYAAMDVYYDVIFGSYLRQLYIARFVKVGDHVFNIYYSHASAFGTARGGAFDNAHIDQYFLPYAEKLYEGVKFLIKDE